MKMDRGNFEDVSSGSAIFEDTKMIDDADESYTNPIPQSSSRYPLLSQESHLEQRSFGIGLV